MSSFQDLVQNANNQLQNASNSVNIPNGSNSDVANNNNADSMSLLKDIFSLLNQNNNQVNHQVGNLTKNQFDLISALQNDFQQRFQHLVSLIANIGGEILKMQTQLLSLTNSNSTAVNNNADAPTDTPAAVSNTDAKAGASSKRTSSRLSSIFGGGKKGKKAAAAVEESAAVTEVSTNEISVDNTAVPVNVTEAVEQIETRIASSSE